MSDLQRAAFSKLLKENREKYALRSDTLTVSQLYEFVKKYDKGFTPGREVSQEVLNKDGTPKTRITGQPQIFIVFIYVVRGSDPRSPVAPSGIVV